MPARRLSRKRVSKPKNLNLKKYFVAIFIAIIFVGIIFVILLSRKSIWNGRDRLSIVMPDQDGGVSLVVLDPRVGEITSVSIPKNTEITASHGKGDWKIGSTWQLGIQEKLGGQLLADSVTKSLRMPVDAWIGSKGNSLVFGSPVAKLKTIIAPTLSNLSISDKFKIVVFSFKVAGKGKVFINLAETGYLEEVRLTDGEYGYRVRKTIPTKLVKLFYVPEITAERALVKVSDGSNGNNARNIADVVQVLGAKVVSIENEGIKDIDCIVRGSKEITVKYIAKAFSCKEVKDDLSEEVIIEFGTNFDRRF